MSPETQVSPDSRYSNNCTSQGVTVESLYVVFNDNRCDHATRPGASSISTPFSLLKSSSSFVPLPLQVLSLLSSATKSSFHQKKMSSFDGSLASLFIDNDTNPDLALLGVDQPEPITEGGEASATSKVPLIGDIPADMEYACGLRSMYLPANEAFLHHNYDISASLKLHFLGPNGNIFPELVMRINKHH